MKQLKKPEQLSQAMLERVAEQFQALAEPSRLKLMNLLFSGEASVGELVSRSSLSLANTSKQLGLLHQAGWVTRRKHGQSVLYRLADERVRALCDLMCSRVRELVSSNAAQLEPPPKRRLR